jgi:hypothetical protein
MMIGLPLKISDTDPPAQYYMSHTHQIKPDSITLRAGSEAVLGIQYWRHSREFVDPDQCFAAIF